VGRARPGCGGWSGRAAFTARPMNINSTIRFFRFFLKAYFPPPTGEEGNAENTE